MKLENLSGLLNVMKKERKHAEVVIDGNEGAVKDAGAMFLELNSWARKKSMAHDLVKQRYARDLNEVAEHEHDPSQKKIFTWHGGAWRRGRHRVTPPPIPPPPPPVLLPQQSLCCCKTFRMEPSYGEWGLRYERYDLAPLKLNTSRRTATLRHRSNQRIATEAAKDAVEMEEHLEEFTTKHALLIAAEGSSIDDKLNNMRDALLKVALKMERSRAFALNKYRGGSYAMLWAKFTPFEIKKMYEKFTGHVRYNISKDSWTAMHEDLRVKWKFLWGKVIEERPLIIHEVFRALDVSRDKKASFTELISALATLLTSPYTQSTILRLYTLLCLRHRPIAPLPYNSIAGAILPHVPQDTHNVTAWTHALTDMCDLWQNFTPSGPDTTWTYDIFLEMLFFDTVPLQTRFGGLVMLKGKG